MNDNKDKLFPMLQKLNVLDKLSTADKELSAKPLMKRCMQVRPFFFAFTITMTLTTGRFGNQC